MSNELIPANRTANGGLNGGRDPRSGRFVLGNDGGPGRPKSVAGLAELAQEFTDDAIHELVKLLKHKNAFVRLGAIKLLLERGYGKPVQPLVNLQQPQLPPIVDMGTIDPAERATAEAEIESNQGTAALEE